MRRLPLALAVAAGIAATGCGTASSDGSGAADVKQTVQAALRALAAGDGHAFCSLATAAERARLAAAFARGNCPEAMRAVGTSLSGPHRAALRHAEVTKVTTNGGTATVSAANIVITNGMGKGFLSDDGTPTRLVRRSDGSWLISG